MNLKSKYCKYNSKKVRLENGTLNTWLGGANFSQGIKAGLSVISYEVTFGGVIGGLGGGIYAKKYGGNFWSGKGAIFEKVSTLNSSSVINENDKLPYNNEYVNDYSNRKIGKIKGLVGLKADGSITSKTKFGKPIYSSNNGYFKNNITGQPIDALTEYLGNGDNIVYTSKSAFISEKTLYTTLVHEYIHVTHNLMFYNGEISTKGFSNIEDFQNFFSLNTERAAYQWEALMGLNNNVKIYYDNLGVFDWANNKYFKWLPLQIPIFK